MNEAEEKNEAATAHIDEVEAREDSRPTEKPTREDSRPTGAPPPATTEVLDGKETEASADLKRKLDEREQALRERETKLSAAEARLQRQRERAAAPEKAEYLGGNSLFD